MVHRRTMIQKTCIVVEHCAMSLYVKYVKNNIQQAQYACAFATMLTYSLQNFTHNLGM
jgi:hypothetical protein